MPQLPSFSGRAPLHSLSPPSHGVGTNSSSDHPATVSEAARELLHLWRGATLRQLQRDSKFAQLDAVRERDIELREAEEAGYTGRIRELREEDQHLRNTVLDLQATQPLLLPTPDTHATNTPVEPPLQDCATIPALSAHVYELLTANRPDENFVGSILDRMQELLEHHAQPGREEEDDNLIRQPLAQSRRDLNIRPPSAFLTGIHCHTSIPVRCGGLSDIFPATLEHEHVALKRLRLIAHNVRIERGQQTSPPPSVPSTSSEPDWSRLAMSPEFYKEAIIWRQLRHPNIQPLLGVDITTFPNFTCLVSPWAALGNVHDAMGRLKGQGYQSPIESWVMGIAKGLAYLHDEGVVHGNLRGNNVLIDDGLQPRLTDFGLSLYTDTDERAMDQGGEGNAKWMSPELLHGDVTKSNEKSDVYAFACTCFELYSGHPSFAGIWGMNSVLKVLAGERPERPENISDRMWDLIDRCWKQDPSERPTMAEVVRMLESGLSA